MNAFNSLGQNKEYDNSEIERKKKELKNNFDKCMNVTFSNAQNDILEEEFKINTIGLVTKEEFKNK